MKECCGKYKEQLIVTFKKDQCVNINPRIKANFCPECGSELRDYRKYVLKEIEKDWQEWRRRFCTPKPIEEKTAVEKILPLQHEENKRKNAEMDRKLEELHLIEVDLSDCMEKKIALLIATQTKKLNEVIRAINKR